MGAKSLLPSLYKREEFPSLSKRGQGRFSEGYIYSIMDSLVHGKHMICYMIKRVQAWQFIDKLNLFTDDEVIAGIAKEYGIEVSFIRKAKMAQDETPIIPVPKHAMDYYDSLDWKAAIVLSLQHTSPLTTPDIIDSIVKNL